MDPFSAFYGRALPTTAIGSNACVLKCGARFQMGSMVVRTTYGKLVTSPTAKRDTQRSETNYGYFELQLNFDCNNVYSSNSLAATISKSF
jgi:hypothetical protein